MIFFKKKTWVQSQENKNHRYIKPLPDDPFSAYHLTVLKRKQCHQPDAYEDDCVIFRISPGRGNSEKLEAHPGGNCMGFLILANFIVTTENPFSVINVISIQSDAGIFDLFHPFFIGSIA
ncbi:hypothetical protein CDAR_585121 [Caerostris darwini]|uniref:Uncharacterized protein n=1 Tax=Caerostris darwini TaxID=1538125 RepID=A0AAV4T5G0_9ARAC|nr:hypothetical protein CDAR_585121 [Caerostris darwini]